MSDQPPSATLVQILLLVFLLLWSMFFSASETAYLSLNKLRMRYLRQRKNKKAIRVDKILKNTQAFLTTGLIGNTIVNSLITVVITTIAVSLFSGETAVGVAVSLATILVLIFGEVVPKAVALAYPDGIALNASIITEVLIKLFKPFVWFFNLLTKPFLFLFGVYGETKSTEVTEDDLKIFFEESEKLGQISKHERVMMEKILSYADIQAKNIMTPRPDIKAIQFGASAEEVLALSEESRFSRFPVYDEDIDNIKGVFYIKDFLISPEFYKNEMNENFDLRNYMREPVFVFEATPSDKLQQLFHNEGQNMLIVLDEYGGTAGVVTLEDLTEEVFGEIEDEYDFYTKKSECIKIANGYLVSGAMQITNFNETFSTEFPDNQHETIAGIVLEEFGDMPSIGAEVKIDEYNFKVLETSKKKIKKLKVTRLTE
ncbi:MAG: hemolysin family protein [Treponemataceae bacterium]